MLYVVGGGEGGRDRCCDQQRRRGEHVEDARRRRPRDRARLSSQHVRSLLGTSTYAYFCILSVLHLVSFLFLYGLVCSLEENLL